MRYIFDGLPTTAGDDRIYTKGIAVEMMARLHHRLQASRLRTPPPWSSTKDELVQPNINF